MVNTTSIKAEDGDKDRCPRCSGKVFEAEKVATGKGIYHRKCFSCYVCSRSLDSYNYSNGPSDEVMCHNCYNKNFGPSVRQFDEEVAQKLLNSIHIVSKDPKKACPR